MKRSPLKRGAPLKRGMKPLKRSCMRRKPRRSRGDKDDRAYLAFVRTLKCCAPPTLQCECSGRIQAHHLTGAGMGQKARDDETMALCAHHHDDLHQLAGPFLGWTMQQRRSWQLRQIAETRALYARTQAA